MIILLVVLCWLSVVGIYTYLVLAKAPRIEEPPEEPLVEEDKEKIVRDQINNWHNSHNGFGVSLNEHLGWSDQEMKSYVLKGDLP